MSIYDGIAPEDILRMEQESNYELDEKKIKGELIAPLVDELWQCDVMVLYKMNHYWQAWKELMQRIGF